MRTQRGYRSLDADPIVVTPEAGMHCSYDTDGNARICHCSEFWNGNPDPGYYVAHEDYSSTARIAHYQISRMKENSR